jgi:hypothetical protein
MSTDTKTPHARPTILAVDDDTTHPAILGRLLHPRYSVSLPVKAEADARCCGTRLGTWQ